MYYFYCPNCGNENEVKALPEGTVGNIRDGFGAPIHHYECPNCHNLDAGFMNIKDVRTQWYREYFRHVIGMYQGIRGFNN